MYRKEIINTFKEKKNGIYGLYNLNTGFIYIGSSINISTRFSIHINSRSNICLISSMLKQGINNISFIILELISEPNLASREDFFNILN